MRQALLDNCASYTVKVNSLYIYTQELMRGFYFSIDCVLASPASAGSIYGQYINPTNFTLVTNPSLLTASYVTTSLTHGKTRLLSRASSRMLSTRKEEKRKIGRKERENPNRQPAAKNPDLRKMKFASAKTWPASKACLYIQYLFSSTRKQYRSDLFHFRK